MSLVNLISGHENNTAASAQIYVFHVPTGSGKHLGETPVPKLARDGTMIDGKVICTKHGNLNMFPAVIGTKESIGGSWYQQSYDIRENEVLKIFASVKATWKSVKSCANLIVQVRDNAAFRKIYIKLLGLPTSKLAVAEITGRLDILSVDDAVGKGVTINPVYEHTYQPYSVEKIFSHEELEPEITSRPKIITTVVEGGEKIRIRRKGRVIEL